jgi:hypothetical protein
MNAFDPTLVRFVLNLIGAVSALLAAGLWFRSTTVSMPDRLDAIAAELQRVGRWNAWAAGATCISARRSVCIFCLRRRNRENHRLANILSGFPCRTMSWQ